MIKVPRDQRVITTTLDWKPERGSEAIRVGKFELDLPALEAKGYIRTVGKNYQLRFLNLYQKIVLATDLTSNALPFGNISTGGNHPSPDLPSVRFSSKATIREIADALNDSASSYEIGQLQLIRKDLKAMKRLASGPIFSKASVHETYAFHSGGQGELQFNIGIEEGGFRHGVAFSFETSISFPDIEVLVKKVPFFNEYLLDNPSMFEGFKTWEWDVRSKKRSANQLPHTIGAESTESGHFIFIGAITPLENVSLDRVLRDFDRLLDLYRYVESAGGIYQDQTSFGSASASASPVATGKSIATTSSWVTVFKPGHTPYPELATATFSERTIDVRLRHNFLQSLIFKALVREFGKDYVGTELRSASGGEIDFAIQKGPLRILAELKISSLARSCIRDAVGQLLEYGYLKESNPPSELWVLGVGVCTGDDTAYLEVLRSKLGVPLFYRQFDEDTGTLGSKH